MRDPSLSSASLHSLLGFQHGGQKGKLRWRKKQAHALPPRASVWPLLFFSLGQWLGPAPLPTPNESTGSAGNRGLALAVPPNNCRRLHSTPSSWQCQGQEPSPFPVWSLMNSLPVASTLRMRNECLCSPAH